MVIVDEEKAFVRAVHSSVLKILQSALRLYEKTGDEKFLEHANWFMEKSSQLKKRL